MFNYTLQMFISRLNSSRIYSYDLNQTNETALVLEVDHALSQLGYNITYDQIAVQLDNLEVLQEAAVDVQDAYSGFYGAFASTTMQFYDLKGPYNNLKHSWNSSLLFTRHFS